MRKIIVILMILILVGCEQSLKTSDISLRTLSDIYPIITGVYIDSGTYKVNDEIDVTFVYAHDFLSNIDTHIEEIEKFEIVIEQVNFSDQADKKILYTNDISSDVFITDDNRCSIQTPKECENGMSYTLSITEEDFVEGILSFKVIIHLATGEIEEVETECIVYYQVINQEVKLSNSNNMFYD